VKFSAQEEYGLRCLLQFGRHEPGASLSIAQLSRLEGISVPNVAKIMRLLRRAGFVRSSRGQAGGYTLARSVDAIVVGEVFNALGTPLFDEQFCDRHAGSEDACTHHADCSIRPVLRRVQDAVDGVMGQLTLGQLLRGETELPPMGPRAIRISVVPPLTSRSSA
jgi:Rrf2 family protein